jgi:hypothetical protein
MIPTLAGPAVVISIPMALVISPDGLPKKEIILPLTPLSFAF